MSFNTVIINLVDENSVRPGLQVGHAPTKDKEKVSIEPSSAVEPLDDHFICSICMCVCISPVCCSKCDKMFCKTCISKWLKMSQFNSVCPCCKNKFV